MSLRLGSGDIRRLKESIRIVSFYDFPAGFGSGLLPPGGTAGQVLVKNSATDYDASWQTLALPVASAHIDVTTPFTTTSGTFVDITGVSVTLTNTVACKYFIAFTASLDTTGAGTATTIAYCINVDGVDTDEQHIDFGTVDTDETASIAHITDSLAPGLHTFKGRMRRVLGTQTAQFTSGMIAVIALQAT